MTGVQTCALPILDFRETYEAWADSFLKNTLKNVLFEVRPDYMMTFGSTGKLTEGDYSMVMSPAQGSYPKSVLSVYSKGSWVPVEGALT